ncbi:acyl-CoA synthetase [Pimelobacter sp. 30-1]|uniref:acyl-CoA synthetase n=1 Tax=Pimelobacter sp. 30-1 TaxID=2004991 RepID=UPI001C04F45C|nr:acyl-CoA synthetase [Pimelobacter sp. 30-1]MBU2693571.1 acyl-CoA synthetase [Pimelobacter sp. 30-1]
MSNPSTHAARHPDKPAVILAETGATLTYAELDRESMQLAQAFRAAGLRPGDHVASAVANHLRNPVAYWAAMRAGLYYTPINTYLTDAEARFIVENCGARAVVVDGRLDVLAAGLADLDLPLRISLDVALPGFEELATVLARHPAEPVDEDVLGASMVYSSGSTGRPKGIKRPLAPRTYAEGNVPLLEFARTAYDVGTGTINLSPAPLYHAAPNSFASAVLGLGGTLVLMERFDASAFLAAIERYAATHALVVPTMFVRLLRLPEAERAAADLSSLRFAMHGASPCPVPVKRSMIDWWGPVIMEYYAGSEDNGSTVITSQEWLAHPGSVGRAFGNAVIHICGPDGTELPTGQDGVVYFETPGGLPAFEYHGEPDKTDSTRHPVHRDWSTLGDVGHLDADGYLYLTDRTDYMIISGGVNISPQEIEDVISAHPAVLDVAVFGVPNEEFGEEVKAVVELDPAAAGPDEASIAEEIRAFVRDRLARHKVPRTVDVIDVMPRSPAGKLYKRQLRDRYLKETATHG